MASLNASKTAVGVLALTLSVALIACGEGHGSSSGQPNSAASPLIEGTATPSITGTPFVDVCQPNPDPATPDEVKIDQPTVGETLTSPVTISGTIVGSERHFRVWIFDAAGKTVAGVNVDNGQPGSARAFSETLDLTNEAATGGCIWVFELTAQSTPVNVAQVPVALPPPG